MQPGAVLREAWAMYKAHWRHLLSIALVFYLVLSLVALLLTAALGDVGVILGFVVSLVGVFWLQGALVEAVADVRDGRADLSLGETFRRVQPRLGVLLGAGLLAGLGVMIGFFLLIVPGLVLLTWWSVLVPVVVLERTAVMESFGRSRALVRGNGWNAFGVIVLTLLILIGFSIVVALATLWLPDEISGYAQSLVSNTLTTPFIALAWTLMYFALKQREAAAAPGAGAEPQLG